MTHGSRAQIHHVSITKSLNDYTYMFTPRATLEALFASFDMDLPATYEASFNASKVLQGNDTLPAGMNIDDIAFGGTSYE